MNTKRYRILQATMLVVVAIACHSCSVSKHSKTDDEIIASIDNSPVYANELNSLIKQELHNEMGRVYEVKKSVLNQLIETKLVQAEAEKHKMSSQEYIEHYTTTRISSLGLDSLLRQYKISSILPSNGMDGALSTSMCATSHIPPLAQLKVIMQRELVASLKKEKNIRIYIYPPRNPLRLLSDGTTMVDTQYSKLRF